MLSKGPFGPFLGAHGLPSTGIQVHNDNSCLMQVVVKVAFASPAVMSCCTMMDFQKNGSPIWMRKLLLD